MDKILGTLLNKIHSSTPPPPTMNSKSFVKVEFMAELLYWIALDCTGVPNKVAGEYRSADVNVKQIQLSLPVRF